MNPPQRPPSTSGSSSAQAAPGSNVTTPLLGQGALGPSTPNSAFLSTSPYTPGLSSNLASPASISFQHATPITAGPSTSTNQPNIAFRRLVWSGTIPICVSIDPADLPPGSDATLDSTYLVVPRISYLPLIVAEVRKNLLEIVLDQVALNVLNERELWFEYEGQPLRWHWQIGLLYDYHTSNPAHTAISTPSAPPLSASGLAALRSELPTSPSASPAKSSIAGSSAARLPWKIKLRLGKPPVDRLHSNAGLESCKTSFMSMIKEADFVRYGSTKKVVNLRKQEQDSLWDGVVNHDYDLFWSIAQKLVPNTHAVLDPNSLGSTRSPITGRTLSLNLQSASEERSGSAGTMQRSLTTQPNESQASLTPSMASAVTSTTTSDPPTTTASGSGTGTPGGNNKADTVRSIPIRIFLPDNAPIVQEPVPPTLDDHRPNTLGAVLSGLFPLLFPPPPSFSSFQPPSPPLAYAIVQGIRMPLDVEIGWLGSTLLGPDGWVSVVIGLLQNGHSA